MSRDDLIEKVAEALMATEAEVGPACMNVEVPPTIREDDDFREAYVQGYRHALADARRAIAVIREADQEGRLPHDQVETPQEIVPNPNNPEQFSGLVGPVERIGENE